MSAFIAIRLLSFSGSWERNRSDKKKHKLPQNGKGKEALCTKDTERTRSDPAASMIDCNSAEERQASTFNDRREDKERRRATYLTHAFVAIFGRRLAFLTNAAGTRTV